MASRSARASSPRFCSSGLLLGAALLAAAPARAALVDVAVLVEVVAVDFGLVGIGVGDRFTFAFTLDDQVQDVAASPGSGQFPNLLTRFSATADAANLGSWDPSGGSYSAGDSNFVTNAFGDNWTLQVRGTGFPDAGAPFLDFSLGFDWPSDVTDSGLGDTFAGQLGVAPGALELSGAALSGEIRFAVGEDFLAAYFLVPEPAGLPGGAAASLALALAAALRRRGDVAR